MNKSPRLKLIEQESFFKERPCDVLCEAISYISFTIKGINHSENSEFLRHPLSQIQPTETQIHIDGS